MSCFAIEAELVSRLDGRLDTADELRVLAHLETCAECRARADAWGHLVPLMRRLAPAPRSPLAVRRMEVEIEHQLAAKPAPGPSPGARGMRWAAVAVAAAAAIAIVAVRLRPAALRAEVTTVDGDARLGADALRGGGRVGVGQEIVVGEHGVVALNVAGAALRLEGGSRLALAGAPDRVELRLAAGTLAATVAHRAPGQTFAVVTSDARVEVRGTRFVVRAGPDGSSVSVDEGRVAVFARDGAERDVGAGERLAIGPGGVIAPPPSPVTPPPTTAPDSAGSAPAEAEPAARPCATAIASCEAAARQARGAMRAGQGARAVRMVEAAMADAEACDDGAPATTSCRDELRYLRAEALREDGRLAAAVAAYRALDRRSAPAAMRQNALYAAAGLEQRLGRRAAARADFERAYAAAPAGALGEEALLGALESAVADGNEPVAAAAARRYLEAFPAGRAAPRARDLAARAGAVR